ADFAPGTSDSAGQFVRDRAAKVSGNSAHRRGRGAGRDSWRKVRVRERVDFSEAQNPAVQPDVVEIPVEPDGVAGVLQAEFYRRGVIRDRAAALGGGSIEHAINVELRAFGRCERAVE